MHREKKMIGTNDTTPVQTPEWAIQAGLRLGQVHKTDAGVKGAIVDFRMEGDNKCVLLDNGIRGPVHAVHCVPIVELRRRRG